MKEITKKRLYCKECGCITHDAEYKIICDYCQQEITDMNENYKETMDFKGCFEDYERKSDEFHFCNIEHFLSFLSNVDIEKYDYIFLPLIYKNNFKKLQERLNK